MSPRCVIKRAVNGYEVEVTDPKIVAENSKEGSKWRSPEMTYVFSDLKSVTKFLADNLETALPAISYDTAFDEAAEA